jgi:hypothetical protein
MRTVSGFPLDRGRVQQSDRHGELADPTETLTIASEVEIDHRAPKWPAFEVDPGAHGYPFAYTLDDLVDLGALAQPD